VVTYVFKSREDSLSWARNRTLARKSTGYRLIVSLQDKRLWAVIGEDTVMNTTVAVAKGTTLEYAGRKYKFDTPRGIRKVLKKESDPVWLPPDWLYVETAEEHGLKIDKLIVGRPRKLADGRSLAVKGQRRWGDRERRVRRDAHRRAHRVRQHAVHSAHGHQEPPRGG
jgi:hypothetical protein